MKKRFGVWLNGVWLNYQKIIIFYDGLTLSERSNYENKGKKNCCAFVALSALLVFAMSMTVIAASAEMARGGNAYLNCNYSNGMRNMSAGTIRGNTVDMASLIVTTTYQDGSVYVYNSGVGTKDQTTSSNYEWSEDYSSIHSLYESADNLYDRVRLSAN